MSKKINHCPDCAAKISKNAKRCKLCATERQRGVSPSKETREKMSAARKRAWESGLYENRETEELGKRKSELRRLDWARGVYGSAEYRKKLSDSARKRQPRERFIKICLFCGCEFEVVRSQLITKYCSRSCSGKALSVRQSGENNHMYGKTGSANPNWRDGSSLPVLKQCETCGIEFEATPYQVGRFCSRQCMDIWHSEILRGDKCHFWKGGHDAYRGINWMKQARKARQRDGHACQSCGKAQGKEGKKLAVHHIKPFRLFDDYTKANSLDNLITLCASCHSTIEHTIAY